MKVTIISAPFEHQHLDSEPCPICGFNTLSSWLEYDATIYEFSCMSCGHEWTSEAEE